MDRKREINHNLNSVRGITIIGIMYIHTISFIVDYNKLALYERYLFSIASLCVPILFMISGYLYHSSRSYEKSIRRTAIEYIKLSAIVIFVNKFILNVHFDIYKFLLFNQSSIGYLWFLKVLLYLQVVIYVYKYKKGYLLTLILLFVVSNNQGSFSEMIFYVVVYLTGYLIAEGRMSFLDYLPKITVLLIFVIPLMFLNQYYTYEPRLYLVAVIFFNWLLRVKSNIRIKFLEFFSKNGLIYLTMQYFVIEGLLRTKFEFNHVFPMFGFILIMSTGLVLTYNFIDEKLREELSKI